LGSEASEEPCPCEKIAHSKLGIISDAERLARVVCSPNHYNENTGHIKPSVFPDKQIVLGTLSLTRADKVDAAELKAIADDVAKSIPSQPQKAAGYLVAKTLDLKNLKEIDGSRSLCVWDDSIIDMPPYRNNPAHALLGKSPVLKELPPPGDDIWGAVKELKKRLVEAFSGLLQTDKIY
jgi:hypothetical protein